MKRQGFDSRPSVLSNQGPLSLQLQRRHVVNQIPLCERKRASMMVCFVGGGCCTYKGHLIIFSVVTCSPGLS